MVFPKNKSINNSGGGGEGEDRDLLLYIIVFLIKTSSQFPPLNSHLSIVFYII